MKKMASRLAGDDDFSGANSSRPTGSFRQRRKNQQSEAEKTSKALTDADH
jgi:hypothetical protein